MPPDADPGRPGDDPDAPARISLSNEAFEGNNNAYLFLGDGEAALVDTGIATAGARRGLRAGLAEHGVEFADLERVVLTHWHADHAGLAGEIQAESGATVCAHPGDSPLIEREDRAVASVRERRREYYDRWGMPDGPREELEAFLERGRERTGDPADVTPVEDGDRIELAGTDVEVVHLPGHTAGLIGLALDSDDGRELLTGDALLPVYTPNVGGADVRVERPLERYLETLERIETGGFRRALPGHREPIDDPAARAREIARHHEERARRVLDALDRIGPADAWTVSADLFGDLAGIHILHGPGEAWAHLDHLERAGYVERDGDEYRLAVAPDEVEEVLPSAGV